MKGRCIIITQDLKQQVLDQLHLNHMGIELLTHKSVYWVNINNDIENHLKNCSMCLELQQMQPKEKIIHHDILLRPWGVIGVNIFQLNNKNYLCVVDYHSKFLVIKRMEELSAENLTTTVNIIFAEYVRCWQQFCFREIQKFLQQSQHQTSSIVIIPPPKQ